MTLLLSGSGNLPSSRFLWLYFSSFLLGNIDRGPQHFVNIYPPDFGWQADPVSKPKRGSRFLTLKVISWCGHTRYRYLIHQERNCWFIDFKTDKVLEKPVGKLMDLDVFACEGKAGSSFMV